MKGNTLQPHDPSHLAQHATRAIRLFASGINAMTYPLMPIVEDEKRMHATLVDATTCRLTHSNL